MAEIRISDLPESGLTANLSNTIFPVVNLETDITGKFPLSDIIALAGGGGGSITVGELNANNILSNTIASVNVLSFDTSVGFDVDPISSTHAKITANLISQREFLNIGSFKTIVVDGQANLVATREDTLEIVTGNNVQIRTNTAADPKQLVIAALDGNTARIHVLYPNRVEIVSSVTSRPAWTLRYDTSTSGLQNWVHSSVVDSNNITYVVGGEEDYDLNRYPATIVKVNQEGTILEKLSFNKPGYASLQMAGNDIAIDDSGYLYIIIPYYISPTWTFTILKLEPNTNTIVWQKKISPTNPSTVDFYGQAIKYLNGDIYFSFYNIDAFAYRRAYVGKMDTDGNLVWVKNFDSADFGSASNIRYNIGFDLDADNNFFYGLGAQNNNDDIIAKISPDDVVLWKKKIGRTPSNQQIENDYLEVDPSGNVYVSGSIQKQTSPYIQEQILIKFDSSGNHVWSRQLSSNSSTTRDDDYISSFDFDDQGNIYTFGYTDLANTFLPNVASSSVEYYAVNSFDTNGNLRWQRFFGNKNFNLFEYYHYGFKNGRVEGSDFVFCGYVYIAPNYDLNSIIVRLPTDGSGTNTQTNTVFVYANTSYNVVTPTIDFTQSANLTISAYTVVEANDNLTISTETIPGSTFQNFSTGPSGNGYFLPSFDGANGQFLRTDGAGSIYFDTATYGDVIFGGSAGQYLRSSGDGTIYYSTLSAAGDNYEMQYNSNGNFAGSDTVTTNGNFLTLKTYYPEKVKIVTVDYPDAGNNYYYLPPGDGNTKQALITDGSGNTYWGNPLIPRIVTQASADSIVLDWSNADVIRVTLANNATFTHTGAVDGQKIILEVTQPAAGATKTVSFTSQTQFGSDISSFTASNANGLTDKLGFIYNEAAGKYRVVAMARGF